MQTEDMRSRVERLHATYVRLSGLELRLDMNRERDWFEWIKQGFKDEDLEFLLKFLKSAIKDGRRFQGCLKFSNLISRTDCFEEDLAIAKAESRKRVMNSNRASVLRSMGRPDEVEQEARSFAEVLESPAFKAFVALKEKL